jgi:FKBP-type peptidyl-prolyl cis-trans isomerase
MKKALLIAQTLSALAKGPQGEGEMPANATLVYVVDLLGEPKSAEEQQ